MKTKSVIGMSLQETKYNNYLCQTRSSDALRSKRHATGHKLAALSQACWERGQQLPALALRKLFERSSEAYQDWNNRLGGYVPPNDKLWPPFLIQPKRCRTPSGEHRLSEITCVAR